MLGQHAVVAQWIEQRKEEIMKELWNIEKTVSKGKYLYAVVRGHPGSTKNGYVLAHRVIMENSLGRLLLPDEVVHHKNGNKKDNRIENLEVMSVREHSRMHCRLRGRKMVKLKCPACGAIFVKRRRNTPLCDNSKEWSACSSSCRGRFSAEMQYRGRTADTLAKIMGNIIEEFVEYPSQPPNPPM